MAAFLAASSCAFGQQDPFRDHSRVPRIEELFTTLEFEPVAFAKVPRVAYDYTAYGSESEFTLRRNRQAFDWVDLLASRNKATTVDPSIELYGTKLSYPILVAPTAGHTQLHPEGEAATYLGASNAHKTTMIVSNNASLPLDKIAAAAKGDFWWQLYPRQNIEDSKALLDTAQMNGARAIVVTIDQKTRSR